MKSKRKVAIGPLDTIGGVVTEMAKLYRAARTGSLDMQDAKALAYILTCLRQAHEVAIIEPRLAALEDRLGGKPGSVVPLRRAS